MNKRIKNDIKIVLNYLWNDEKIHYQSEPSKNHIYIVLRRLAKEIGYNVN